MSVMEKEPTRTRRLERAPVVGPVGMSPVCWTWRVRVGGLNL